MTPTGAMVEEGKRQIEVNGKPFLLETALRSDFALIQAFLADYLGNLTYALTARNFNPVMAMAADAVIVSAEQIVPCWRHRAQSCRDSCAARRLSHRQRVNHGCSIDHRATVAFERTPRELDDPGEMVAGMRGAMDLVSGAKGVIVAMWIAEVEEDVHPMA